MRPSYRVASQYPKDVPRIPPPTIVTSQGSMVRSRGRAPRLLWLRTNAGPGVSSPKRMTMETSWGKGNVGSKARLTLAVAGILVALAVTSGLASAMPAMKWTFHAGDAFLRSLNPSFSPVVAKNSTNGDTVAVMGGGTYNPGGRVSGAGQRQHVIRAESLKLRTSLVSPPKEAAQPRRGWACARWRQPHALGEPSSGPPREDPSSERSG